MERRTCWVNPVSVSNLLQKLPVPPALVALEVVQQEQLLRAQLASDIEFWRRGQSRYHAGRQADHGGCLDEDDDLAVAEVAHYLEELVWDDLKGMRVDRRARAAVVPAKKDLRALCSWPVCARLNHW